jgi:KipI family sensor histidine kinase inhibitor
MFDPDELPRDRLAEQASRSAGRSGAGEAPSRLVRLPVAYGGEAALDLAELARGAALPEEELVRRHAGAEYRVAFIGFAPGFAYLTGLPLKLHAARLPSPRPRVPSGAVAIGGPYTGVYPSAMPGGWRLIGRSSAALFDPDANPPALLSPGDRVRFDPVGESELPPPAPHTPKRPSGRPVLRVASPGLLSTIQGAPRYGWGSSGVPAGGAMDRFSLARANALLGNGAGDPALEITLIGPELEALESIDVAIAGADFAAELDGKPAPPDRILRIPAGGRLRLSRARRGVRAYLAVGGGLVEPHRLGESARRIEAGEDLFSKALVTGGAPTRVPKELAPAGPVQVRVVPGPQLDHFAPAAVERFFSTPWRVSPVSDRRGLRLEGERLEHARAPEIPPEGTVFGSIQIPGQGFPIVLGPDGPVTGGYPKIATVIESDLPWLGQAAPGDILRFRPVTLDEALEARREYH